MFEILKCLMAWRKPVRITLDRGAFHPVRAHGTDAGADLRSREFRMLNPHDSVIIDTGVHVQLPKHTVGFLKSKSGLMMKGIVSEGVIDEGYTGGIRVKLFNHSDQVYPIHPGDKITQLVIIPVLYSKFIHVGHLNGTERGNNGFGSTGR